MFPGRRPFFMGRIKVEKLERVGERYAKAASSSTRKADHQCRALINRFGRQCSKPIFPHDTNQLCWAHWTHGCKWGQMKNLHVHCDQRSRDFLELAPSANEINDGPGLVVTVHEISGVPHLRASVTYDRASVEELVEKLDTWLEETK